MTADAVDVDEVPFTVAGERLSALHYTGRGSDFGGDSGRACVVMAHGFGGTRDTGLPGYAERLSGAGLDVVLFDYRHFGASGGEPRQLLSPRRQRDDYAAAVAFARGLADVDPRRIVVWGVSYSGGHVFQVAAEDPEIAGLIALTPAPDGLAALREIIRRDGPAQTMRLSAAGLRDLAAAVRGRPPVTAALAGPPGELAALTAPGALEGYLAIAGPTWRNEVAARIFLQVAGYRPIRKASAVRCAALVQVADNDRTAPPASAMRAAELARAEVRHLPCDHFDVYPGAEWFDPAARQQVDFLRRRLAARIPAATGAGSASPGAP